MKAPFSALIVGLFFSLPIHAEPELSDEFYNAPPKLQLYMAYGEFKMAHYDAAHAMWQQILKEGNGEAAFNLGILYEQGLGVTQSLDKALEYYLLAAENGSRAGAYQVGLMHLGHPDKVKDEVALHWLTVAALDGDTDAAELIESIQSGDSVNKDPLLVVRQLLIQGKHQEALDKLKTLTREDPPNYEAITRLAWLYETGLGVEQDITEAGRLFQIAAKGGNAEAQYAIAVMHETGVGQAEDKSLAEYWLNQSAAQGYKPALEKQKNN